MARWMGRLEAALAELAGKRLLPFFILLTGLLPSAWLFYELRDTPQLGSSGDDVMYIGAARSLADHGTYRESAFPGDPWQTKYPPGYPLMLAAILKWNPVNLHFWIIAHSWVWMAVASFALAWAMRQTGLTRVQAAFVGALWAANPGGANAAIFAMADTPYCAVLFLVLGLVLRLDKEAVWNTAMVGLVMGTACLIRSTGIVAIAGLVVWLLWRKSFRTAMWFGVSASIFPAIWMLWSHTHMPPDHGPVAEYYFSYGGRWIQTVRQSGVGSILRTNVVRGVSSLGILLVPFESRGLLEILWYTILLALGCTALVEWGGGAITAVALATAGLQLFWNWPPNVRFFLPVAPAFLGAGVAMLSSRPAILRVFVIVAVAVADIYVVADGQSRYASLRDVSRSSAYDFIERELPTDAVILGDERVWLFTGRRALVMPAPMEYMYLKRLDSEIEFFMTYKDVARQFGAGYILLEPWDGHNWNVPIDQAKQFADAMRSDPDLERIFSQNGVELFRIRTNSPGSP
ncbi:MAG TPA: hypothetical protein VGQ49_02305 [Bryobacteraceae bacterium]|nr:hypothetical protein [Bryobacteraceae bacterium]